MDRRDRPLPLARHPSRAAPWSLPCRLLTSVLTFLPLVFPGLQVLLVAFFDNTLGWAQKAETKGLQDAWDEFKDCKQTQAFKDALQKAKEALQRDKRKAAQKAAKAAAAAAASAGAGSPSAPSPGALATTPQSMGIKSPGPLSPASGGKGGGSSAKPKRRAAEEEPMGEPAAAAAAKANGKKKKKKKRKVVSSDEDYTETEPSSVTTEPEDSDRPKKRKKAQADPGRAKVGRPAKQAKMAAETGGHPCLLDGRLLRRLAPRPAALFGSKRQPPTSLCFSS